MKKTIAFTLLLFIAIGCHNFNKKTYKDLALTYATLIDEATLEKTLHKLASDEFEGRETGEKGQKLTAEYLRDFYVENKINAPVKYANYFQVIPKDFLPPGVKTTENVLALIEGNEYPEEILVISAHYDHLGIGNNGTYYGADDNGSGTSAVMAIAKSFQRAKEEGNGPKRSILFLHLTAEEKGLYGSKWYVKHPVSDLKNHITDLNIDMIGRVDKAHNTSTNYLYLIGSDKLSTELHNLSENVNKKYSNIYLDYTYNDVNDPNRFYYRSDHYNFAKNNIPVIFYFNGVHDDYHKTTDTATKIDYPLLTTRTQLIFYTAWEIANRPQKIKVDTKN